MKNLLLFVFSLMTGFEASSEVKGCHEFICKYSHTTETYQNVSGVNSTPVTFNTSKQSTQCKEWETKDGVSLSHYTKNKNLGIILKSLNDIGTYDYNQTKPDTYNGTQIVENKDCQRPFHQTAYISAPITIRCDLDRYYSMVKFICKVTNVTCKKISEKLISFKKSSYSVSLQNVTQNHNGVYWCGVKDENGVYGTAVRRIKLEVTSITVFKRSPPSGENFTYFCKYEDVYNNIFICKGEDPSICQPLVNTTKTDMNTKFSMNKETKKKKYHHNSNKINNK